MSPVKRKRKGRPDHLLGRLLLVLLVLHSLLPVQTQAASAKSLNPSVDTVITNVGNYMLSVDTNPDYSSIWNVIGMVRAGRNLPSSYLDTFYNNTVNYLEENNWQITRAKYSDYSKLILAMTAIGKDARDIDGHNLLEYLSDFSKVKLQGFNGPIWALIALNCHPDYELPVLTDAKEQTTEEGLIQYLLSRQITVAGKEGWTLTGSVPDTDITGMTIQALAPYYGKRDDVTAAVDKALGWLSSAQNSSGGYSTLNGSGSVETSESDDQVIVALSAIGIDCQTDSRFITSNGSWVMSRLFEYYSAVDSTKGGFMHVFAGAENNGGGAAGSIDGMATEQGLYAVVAYKRMLEGKTALYDMSDIDLSSGEAAVPTTATTKKDDTSSSPGGSAATTAAKDDTTGSAGQTGKSSTSKKVKVTKLTLNYKQITLKKGKTRTLKLKVTPSNASNKKVKWTSSNKKVATVSQKGKVKAIRTGRAKITVTAKDGSGKKAVCTVIVQASSSGTSAKSSGNKGSSSKKVKITDLSLAYKQISVAVGASRSIPAVITPTDASNRKLTWTSSDQSIATVSQSGSVTGKSAGTVTITAKAKDGSGKTASCSVVVYGTNSSNSSYSSSGSGGSAYSGSGSSGNSQYAGTPNQGAAGSGQQYSGQQAAAGSGNSQTSANGASGQAGQTDQNTDGASAWSFDGDAYIPDSSSGSSSDSQAGLTQADGSAFPSYDPGLEDHTDGTDDYADDTDGSDQYGDTVYDAERNGSYNLDLPPWLNVILGLLVPGGIAAAFKVPWDAVGKRLLLLAAAAKRRE